MRERFENFDSDSCGTVAKGCAGGCLTFIGIGVATGLLGAALVSSCSVRIPATDSNLSGVAAVGEKQQVQENIPSYIQNRDKNIAAVDAEAEVSIGSLRLKNIGTIGKQPNPPIFELNIEIPPTAHSSGTFNLRRFGVTITENTASE